MDCFVGPSCYCLVGVGLEWLYCLDNLTHHSHSCNCFGGVGWMDCLVGLLNLPYTVLRNVLGVSVLVGCLMLTN